MKMIAFAEGLEVQYKKKKIRKDNPKIIDQSSNCMSVGSRVGCEEGWGAGGRSVYEPRAGECVCLSGGDQEFSPDRFISIHKWSYWADGWI